MKKPTLQDTVGQKEPRGSRSYAGSLIKLLFCMKSDYLDYSKWILRCYCSRFQSICFWNISEFLISEIIKTTPPLVNTEPNDC